MSLYLVYVRRKNLSTATQILLKEVLGLKKALARLERKVATKHPYKRKA